MPQTLCIPVSFGCITTQEYKSKLHDAIAEVKKLVFERREIDLNDKQSEALFMLTDLQELLVKKGVIQ